MIQITYTNTRTGRNEVESVPFSRAKEIIAAVTSPAYAYSRTRSRMGYEAAAVYHRNAQSPSGVLLATYGPDALVTAILRRNGQTSPLSPTEMLGNIAP